MKLSVNLTIKLFHAFKIVYTHKWQSSYQNDDDIKAGIAIWSKRLERYSENVITKSITECIDTLAWPPSIAEFIAICDKYLKIPSQSEILQKCIRRDLSHPLVKTIFDKIGSWDFSHDSQKNLERKINEHYHKALTELKSNLLEDKNQELLNAPKEK